MCKRSRCSIGTSNFLGPGKHVISNAKLHRKITISSLNADSTKKYEGFTITTQPGEQKTFTDLLEILKADKFIPPIFIILYDILLIYHL